MTQFDGGFLLMRTLMSLACLTCLAVAGTASAAAPRGSQNDPVTGAVAACRTIGDAAQRLACFDKAAAGLASAVEKGDIAVVTREQATKTRQSLFGFAVPDFPFFKRSKEEAELKEIKTTIVSARPHGPGMHRLQVAEANAVWETMEALRREPEAGQPVTITRGVLGSYWIKVGNQREVRGRRVQ